MKAKVLQNTCPVTFGFQDIRHRQKVYGSQNVIFHLLLESVLPEFDQHMAIYTFSVMK
jgi:hypothetical protein